MSNLNMDELFKNALDQPSAPVSTRVWSTIQPLLPKPWYLQAWIGWLVAVLSLGGLVGTTYQLVQLKKEVQHLQLSQRTLSRIDTVYVSRVDTLYLVNQGNRYLPGSFESTTRLSKYLNANHLVEPSNSFSTIPDRPVPSSFSGASNGAPESPMTESSAREVLSNQDKPSGATSTEVKDSEAGGNGSPEITESKSEDASESDSKENRTQPPLTSDVRLILSPSVSTRGSWSLRWVAEWEIRQNWAIGAGFQSDFFPEIEYDRVIDFARVYGRNPNQVYTELADVSNEVQQRMEDIEIQRAIFSIPMYARYYLAGQRNWRFYPEMGYRLNVWTRERVDVDIDTETGHDFRLFTAKNPTRTFSNMFIGAGFEWQNRGWAIQAGGRWVPREGVSFQLGVAKSIFEKNNASLWRF